MKKLLPISLLVIGSSLFTHSFGQVAINNSATNPDPSAILDLNTGNGGTMGFLAPQVALTNVAVAAPVTSPATGLMVYSSSAPLGGNGTGYYYWNGAAWASLNNMVNGSGIANYVAEWTPNGTTLGTGVIQDNGAEIGVNYAPSLGYEASVNAASGDAIWSETNDANYYAVDAYNLGGTAVYCSGTSYGIYGYTSDPGGIYAGVYGQDDNWIGVYGSSVNEYGVQGNGGAIGVYGNSPGSGNGVYAQSYGSTALYAVSDTSTLSPVMEADNNANATAVKVNYYDGTTHWKVTGNGSVGTVVKDIKGNEVRLACPESPEIYFEDYGQGQLVNGKAHINLDPAVAQNVTINEKHPLRAYIQLEGDCNGVYVANKTATGFDVVELKHGTSNTSFQWHIVCNRADETMANGKVSHNADIRFPKVVNQKGITGTNNFTKSSVQKAPVKRMVQMQPHHPQGGK